MQTLREMTSQQIGALAVLAALDVKRSQIDSSDAMAEALTAALVRYGLMHNDPPGFEDWGLTEYGRSVVGYLSGIDIGSGLPRIVATSGGYVQGSA